jgi:signal transduction histidine kinase
VFASTDIGSLLQRIVLLFGEEAVAKRIEITITTDERLLEQVFINLVHNAIDAADKPHTSIGIKACNDGKDLLVEVSDNGCGIASENLGSIFTPFFTTKSAGTGIGLFISRKIVQALHGTLTVQSIQKQRTVFRLRLPL